MEPPDLSVLIFVNEVLVMPVRRQWEVYPELRGGIRLYLVEVVSHLERVQVGSAAYHMNPSASDRYISPKVFSLVVVVNVIFRCAGRFLHALEPHPHQRILADRPRLCLTDYLDSVSSVLEK